MLAEDLGLDVALWERQDEIFDRINPRPILLRLGQWWRYDTGHWVIRPRIIHSYLQRAGRGYSDRDTWDLRAYLVEVIAGSVERFAELTNGYPAELTPEEWDDILNRISGGIRSAVQRLNDMDLDKEGQTQAEGDLRDSLGLFVRWLPHLLATSSSCPRRPAKLRRHSRPGTQAHPRRPGGIEDLFVDLANGVDPATITHRHGVRFLD